LAFNAQIGLIDRSATRRHTDIRYKQYFTIRPVYLADVIIRVFLISRQVSEKL